MDQLDSVEVFLVEDNPGDVVLTREALEDTALDVTLTTVVDGTTAISALEARVAESQRLPDLVLLDLNLPGMHGHEVLAQIRADDRLQHLPVIIMTSSESEVDVVAAYRGAANSYITKPLNPDEFMDVVSRLGDYWLGVAKLPGRFA